MAFFLVRGGVGLVQLFFCCEILYRICTYRTVELFPSFEAVVSERDGQSLRPEFYATNELTKREDTETRPLEQRKATRKQQ